MRDRGGEQNKEDGSSIGLSTRSEMMNPCLIRNRKKPARKTNKQYTIATTAWTIVGDEGDKDYCIVGGATPPCAPPSPRPWEAISL